MRGIEFRLRELVWMQSEDATRGANRPEPIALPWDPEPEGVIRGDVMTLDEAAHFLGWEAELAGG